MDYRAIAQTILLRLPTEPVFEPSSSHESDDERIAQVVWRRMQLEMDLDPRVQPLSPASLPASNSTR